MRAFGKYRLVEPIACGGMAEVWRAEAPGPEGFVKDVALKLVRAGRGPGGEFVRMFVKEARLASRLTHANIVQVFEFDEVDGQYYIAMELVRGKTLREVVDRCRERGVRLGLARAVHVMAEVARALAYAHRLEEGGRPVGLVHRDVSPQNVLLSFEGEVKLADFGIARAMDAGETTAPGTIKGKAAYMAPEQARGEAVDARADVFALGVVLWELCAGRRLFARDSEANTLAALLGSEPPSPPSAWNEEAPPELDALVARALERDPARRTASAEELAQGLAELRLRLATNAEELDLRAFMWRLWPDGAEPVRREGQTLVRPVVPLPAAVPLSAAMGGDDEATTRTLPRPVEPRAGRRGLVAALVVGCLVAAAGGGVVSFARRSGRGSAAAATTTPTPTATPNPAPAPAPLAHSLADASLPPDLPSLTSGASPPRPPIATVMRGPPMRVKQAGKKEMGIGPTSTAEAKSRDRRPGERRGAADSADGHGIASPSSTLPRGTLIPAKLVRGLDPAWPGAAEAVVTEDVVSGGVLVVPKGSAIACSSRASQDGRIPVSCDGIKTAGGAFSFSGLAVGEGQRVGLRLFDGGVPAGSPFVVYVNASAPVR